MGVLTDRAVTVERVKAIVFAPMSDALRNHLVTLAYVDMGTAMAELLGTSEDANWTSLAVWPSFTVGEMAKPRTLRMRLPLVVSIDSTALMSGVTSRAFIASIDTGESMKSTGRCGLVGASGQTCVATTTSPSRTSPSRRMNASLRAMASAATAPSASETKPIRDGRAPTPFPLVESGPKRAVFAAFLLFLSSLVTLPFFKAALLPEFREGHFVAQLKLMPGASLTEMMRIGHEASRLLLEDPRIATVAFVARVFGLNIQPGVNLDNSAALLDLMEEDDTTP